MNTPDGDPGFRVTLRDVWDEVRALTGAVERLADHETRLRKVERWLYALPLALLLGLAELVLKLWRH